MRVIAATLFTLLLVHGAFAQTEITIAPEDSVARKKDSLAADPSFLNIVRPGVKNSEAEKLLLTGTDEPEEGALVLGEKKKNKNGMGKGMYEGLPIKKITIRRRSASGKEIRETFFVLKKFQMPDPYVREVWRYHIRKDKLIAEGDLKKQAEKGEILIPHGHYLKKVDDKVVAEGDFFIGTKHGRWEEYGNDGALTSKKKYHHGWPKDAQIYFYDAERTKIKEVIPYVNGVLDGDYFLFHDNKQIAESGKYQNGVKVGLWTEYHKLRRMKKKEIQYPDDSFDRNISPKVLHEWDEKGNLLYDSEPDSPQH